MVTGELLDLIGLVVGNASDRFDLGIDEFLVGFVNQGRDE